MLRRCVKERGGHVVVLTTEALSSLRCLSRGVLSPLNRDGALLVRLLAMDLPSSREIDLENLLRERDAQVAELTVRRRTRVMRTRPIDLFVLMLG